MNTTLILIIVLALIVLFFISFYNGLVRLRNNRENAFADIDVQLKQRADLIPNLVNAVKGYATHERETLERVVNARNQTVAATSINDKIAADNALTSALSGLRITLEAYPDLKANQNFLHLQQEIADLENKLSAVRRYFNSATREYNNKVQTFPSNLIASMFGFKKEVMYDLGSELRATMDSAPPEIKF
jgi:LemA protein